MLKDRITKEKGNRELSLEASTKRDIRRGCQRRSETQTRGLFIEEVEASDWFFRNNFISNIILVVGFSINLNMPSIVE